MKKNIIIGLVMILLLVTPALALTLSYNKDNALLVLDNYYNKSEVYNMTEVDNLLSALNITGGTVNLSDYYNITEIDNLFSNLDYYNTSEIDALLANLSVTVNLTNYYNKSESDNRYYLDSNPDSFIDDGNTNWDNSYGFITDGNTLWNNIYGFVTDANLTYSETDPIWTGVSGNYYTSTQVDNLPVSTFSNDAGYITSLSGYYNSPDNETDPVYSAWDKSTGISITESQVSDLQSYLLVETDSNYFTNPYSYYNSSTLPTFTDTNETTRVNTLFTNASNQQTQINLNTNKISYNDSTVVNTLQSDVITLENAGYITTETDPLSLHLNQDNWNNDPDGYISWETSDTITFNQSKLETTYYNVTSINVVRGTPSGDLSHINAYNGNSYNVTEVTGADGLDVIFNFSNVEDFNQLIFRYKTSASESHSTVLYIYDFDDLEWESYGTASLVEEFTIFTFTVFDSEEHIDADGDVLVRVYSESNGNTGHTHYFDWVSISDGFATPSGAEIDPHWESEKANYATIVYVDANNTAQESQIDLNTIASGINTAKISYNDSAIVNTLQSDVITLENAGYITDGNTLWENIYGFVTNANLTYTETDSIANGRIDTVNNSINNLVNFSGDYNDLSNQPSIPIDTNETVNVGILFTNASNQQTQINLNTAKISYNDSTVVNTLQSDVINLENAGYVTYNATLIADVNTNNAKISYNDSAVVNTLQNDVIGLQNAGYITDGNTNWDNSYGFVTYNATLIGEVTANTAKTSYNDSAVVNTLQTDVNTLQNAGYITDGNTNWDNSYGFVTDANLTYSETDPVFNLAYSSLALTSDIDTQGEVETLWGVTLLNSETDPVFTAVSGLYQIKTDIDTQGEVETIWGVTLATDSELSTGLATQDACSEITGCIENAITDGNTNWDNSYGFVTYNATLVGEVTANTAKISYNDSTVVNTLQTDVGTLQGAGYITDGNTGWNDIYGFYNSSDFSISNYLPLAGGVMTGNINMSSHNVTSTECIIFTNGAELCGV